MEPRRNALGGGEFLHFDDECFSLDVVELKEYHQIGEFLSETFADSYKYSLDSFVLAPKYQVWFFPA